MLLNIVVISFCENCFHKSSRTIKYKADLILVYSTPWEYEFKSRGDLVKFQIIELNLNSLVNDREIWFGLI
jgi:hypothetical protein